MPISLFRLVVVLTGSLLLAAFGVPSTVQGQVFPADSASSFRFGALQWSRIGSDLDDRLRLAQLRDTAVSIGLLRSGSSFSLRKVQNYRRGVFLIAPEIDGIYNSDLPFAQNAGELTGGKGVGTRLLAGAVLRFGPLTVVAAPEYIYQQDEAFDALLPEAALSRDYRLPWYEAPSRANLPLRYEERSELVSGQSSARLAIRNVEGGISTEERWLGPGIRNALVLSDNAPGVLHAFIQSSRPFNSPLGEIEAVWLFGRLHGQELSDSSAHRAYASLSTAAVSLRPRWAPNLTVGAARSVTYNLGVQNEIFGRWADVFTRWKGGEASGMDNSERYDQLISLFGRWAFPSDGLEVYGEWARQKLPSSFSEFAQRPGYSSGYTIGTQWARPIPWGNVRVQGELTYLEQTAWAWPVERFYTSSVVYQGYTHEAKSVGAAIGPGASSQWLAADYFGRNVRIGMVGGRIRWDNDAYYTVVSPSIHLPGFGHDVTLYGGMRGSVAIHGSTLHVEWLRGARLNYLYQNRAHSWDGAGASSHTVDVYNNNVKVELKVGAGTIR